MINTIKKAKKNKKKKKIIGIGNMTIIRPGGSTMYVYIFRTAIK